MSAYKIIEQLISKKQYVEAKSIITKQMEHDESIILLFFLGKVNLELGYINESKKIFKTLIEKRIADNISRSRSRSQDLLSAKSDNTI